MSTYIDYVEIQYIHTTPSSEIYVLILINKNLFTIMIIIMTPLLLWVCSECIPAQKMRGLDSARLGKLWRINFNFSHLT